MARVKEGLTIPLGCIAALVCAGFVCFWCDGLGRVVRNPVQHPDGDHAKTGGKPEQDQREDQHDENSWSGSAGVAH